MSWRIETRIIDRTQIAAPSSGLNGAMVIRGAKGTAKPVLIQKGDTDRLINIFGKPSSAYPDIWEAIEFNKGEPLWVSSPHETADTYGGVLVTTAGAATLGAGVTASGIGTYTFPTPTVQMINTVGVGTGAQTTFNYMLTHVADAPGSANFDILKNGVDQVVTLGAPTGNVYGITGPNLTTGSQYDANTRILTLVFTVAPLVTETFTVRYTVVATSYFALFAKSPYADDLGIKCTKDAVNNTLTINLYKKDSAGAFATLNTYLVSLVPGAKDGFGKTIYIGDVFENNDFVQVKLNGTPTLGAFQNDASVVAFNGGNRATVLTATLVAAWDEFKKSKTYPAKIFMSTIIDSSVVAAFDGLRDFNQVYGKYIMPLTMANDVTAAISEKSGYGANNRGLRFYWNWAKVNTTYGKFWTSLVGRIGLKHAAMKDIFFGGAPAWYDENGHGGELGSGIDQLMFDPTEAQLQQLDEAGINPIVMETSGAMIVSQKTAQNPATLTDTSYIAHSDLVDYIFENVLQFALKPQQVKLNDSQHRSRVKAIADNILQPIQTAGLLAEFENKCDSGNNNADVLARKEFVLTTAIKLTPYSERLRFNLILTEQGVSVSQVVA